MPVTDQQVAVFRALLGGDAETFKRLHAGLDRKRDNIGFGALLGCCFLEAVERRFERDGTSADAAEIIEFVGDVRARTVRLADELDARVAERVILFALGDGELDDVDGRAFWATQLIVLMALAADADLDDTEADAFMAKVRPMADDWADNHPGRRESAP